MLLELLGCDDNDAPVVLSAEELLTVVQFSELKALRRSLMFAGGLPVVMLLPHPDVKQGDMRTHTLFTLRTACAGEVLLAAEHTRMRSSERRAQVLDYALAGQQLRRAGDSANARRAVFVAMLGVAEAAKVLHLRPNRILRDSATAARRADIDARAWEAYLEAECRDRGVAVATRPMVETARRRMAAAEAAAASNSKFDFMEQTAADTLMNARKREAVNFIIDRYGQESAHKTCIVNGDRTAVIFLRADRETIWRAYLREYGERALSRSCFLYSAFLPCMKVMSRQSCLCARCLAGGAAIVELERWASTTASARSPSKSCWLHPSRRWTSCSSPLRCWLTLMTTLSA